MPERPIPNFTVEEIVAEIDRELAMRRRVYPGQIAKGSLSVQVADRQIDLLRRIKHDYVMGTMPPGLKA